MLTKPSIDIDPELLRTSAAAQVHAADQGWKHVMTETTGHVPTILGTLVPEGPWAWAIMMIPQPDGSIVLPVQTTYEGIEEMYKMIRGHSDVLGAEPLVEVRGQWYAMHEDVAGSREKSTGIEGERDMVLVLPVQNGPGITGELCWVRMDRQQLGTADVPLATPEKDAKTLRRHMLALHNEFMAALLAGDADRIAALYTPGCRGAVRDYVNDTGTITPDRRCRGCPRALPPVLRGVRRAVGRRAAPGDPGVVPLRGAALRGGRQDRTRSGEPARLQHREPAHPGQGRPLHRGDRARLRPGPDLNSAEQS